MKKKYFFVSIKRENGILSVHEIKCPKSGTFTNKIIILGWGESGKAILQVSIAVFSGAVETFFRQRWFSPLQKMVRTPVFSVRYSIVILSYYV